MKKSKKDSSVKSASVKKAQEAAKDPKVTLGKVGPQWAYYVSANPEPVKWEMNLAGEKFNGKWNKDHTHCVWRIPSSLKANMERHTMFLTGRIISGDGE